MGALEGRVAVITGAGRGIGREHALLFAREGAAVVVNDLGGSNSGDGADAGPAREVVNEIVAAGGRAVANTDNIATWAGAEALVAQAVSEFGGLDVVVNNAGILRDGFIPTLSESDWDAVVAVHLKGHFAVIHHASAYWKAESKAGRQPNAAIVNTASASGITVPNAGQANYGASKAAIAALTQVAADELQRYGVRANAIAPIARTRLTLATPVWARSWLPKPPTPKPKAASTLSARPTSRRWSRTSPARSARSPARSSRCRAVRSANSPAGTTSRPSRPTRHGRSMTSPRDCPEPTNSGVNDDVRMV